MDSVSKAHEQQSADPCWVVKARQHESRLGHPVVADHAMPTVAGVPSLELPLVAGQVLAASMSEVLG